MSAVQAEAFSIGEAGGVRPGRYAAIDIGTVTCRMLIADVNAAGVLHELRREYAITNLGEGVDATGVLKTEAMSRVADTIARYREILAQCQPADGSDINTIAVATSASRDATNASDFVEMLADLGIVLTVVPGKQEAALSFAGASRDFAGENLLVVDIGGGSTEITAGKVGDESLNSHSFDIGCRRVTERFLHSDPPALRELMRARAWVEEGMRSFFKELGGDSRAPRRLVAVAGTATSVVAVHKRLDPYDSERVHKAVIDRETLDEVYGQLATVSLEQRKRIVGLDPGRASVMVAGLIILQVVMDLAHVDFFTTSESDILHGIILNASK